MTTMEERVSALKAARALLLQLAGQPDGTEAARIGRWYLQDYPKEVVISHRLLDLQGYRLLMAVRRIERVGALLEQVEGRQAQHAQALELDLGPWSDEARRIVRHYPPPHELATALHSPRDARVWAAFYLDRPPGRLGVLRSDEPPTVSVRAVGRRSALRCLPSVLASLERDPILPPWGVAEAQQVMTLLPSRSELGCRLAGLSVNRLNQVFAAVERACQLLEALVDRTFPASIRTQARVQRISRHLPHSEAFSVAFLGKKVSRTWIQWLFAAGPENRRED